MITLVYCLRRLHHLSAEEFHRYWRDEHAPLVAWHAEDLGIRSYVQLHGRMTGFDAALRASRGSAEPYDGIALLQYDSLESLKRHSNTPEGRVAGRALLADEEKFIDLPASPLCFADENLVVPMGEAP